MDPKRDDKLDESEMIKASDPAAEDEGKFNSSAAKPMSASGQPLLDPTDKGYDVKAEDEEDPAADPPTNDGPEDQNSDEPPKDDKKPPFAKKADDAPAEEDEEDDEEDEEEEPVPVGVTASAKSISFGTALKALGNGRVGGYLISFGHAGDADLAGEWFDRSTNFHFDDGYPVKGEPVLFHHGMDKKIGVKRIGQIETMTMDEAGIWAEAVLNQRDAYERAIYQLAEQGKLAYSSGALPQGVQISKSGHITDWPIIEGSLTPMPMQPFKTQIIPVKSLPEAGDLLAAVETGPQTPTSRKATRPTGEPIMTLIQERMVDAVLSAFASDAGLTLSPDEAASARKAAVDKLIELSGEDDNKAKDAAKSAEFIDMVEGIVRSTIASDDVETAVKARLAAKSTPKPQAEGFQRDPVITMRSKYADLSAADMAFLAMGRRADATRKGTTWNEDGFMPEMVDKAQKGLSAGSIKVEHSAMKGLMGVKANELNHTTNTGYGAEWVADLWSSDLWTKERFEQSVVASRIRTIDLPSDPYTLPLEAGDPTIYHVAETTAEDTLALDISTSPIPDSKVGTANLTITTEKIGGRVGFSTEITEDSIIPFIPQLRGQLLRAIADGIDYTIINGDTAATTANVSYKGGTATSSMLFTAFNGLRKHGLGQATGTLATGTLTLATLRQLRFKLAAPLAVNINNLAMFVDVQTYGKMLSIDELNIWYMNGRNATVNTGTVPMIDGIPVYPSDQIPLVDSTGYVTSTSSGTLGQLLLVPLNQWIMGYRRRVSATIEFLSYYDSYQLTATARVGMINRGASSAVNVALMYNIPVS